MGGTSGGAGRAKAPPLFLNEGHSLTTFSRSTAHARVCCRLVHSQRNTHVLTAVGYVETGGVLFFASQQSFLRTTMSQNRLNFFMLLYIHEDKTIDLRAAMAEFIEKNPERRHIFGTP